MSPQRCGTSYVNYVLKCVKCDIKCTRLDQKGHVSYGNVHKNILKPRSKILENHKQSHNTDTECHKLT